MRYQMIALALGLMGATLFAPPGGQRHGGPVFVPASRASASVSRRSVGHRQLCLRSGSLSREQHLGGGSFAQCLSLYAFSGFGLPFQLDED